MPGERRRVCRSSYCIILDITQLRTRLTSWPISIASQRSNEDVQSMTETFGWGDRVLANSEWHKVHFVLDWVNLFLHLSVNSRYIHFHPNNSLVFSPLGIVVIQANLTGIQNDSMHVGSGSALWLRNLSFFYSFSLQITPHHPFK